MVGVEVRCGISISCGVGGESCVVAESWRTDDAAQEPCPWEGVAGGAGKVWVLGNSRSLSGLRQRINDHTMIPKGSMPEQFLKS
jgi:hypothetical protein